MINSLENYLCPVCCMTTHTFNFVLLLPWFIFKCSSTIWKSNLKNPNQKQFWKVKELTVANSLKFFPLNLPQHWEGWHWNPLEQNNEMSSLHVAWVTKLHWVTCNENCLPLWLYLKWDLHPQQLSLAFPIYWNFLTPWLANFNNCDSKLGNKTDNSSWATETTREEHMF